MIPEKTHCCDDENDRRNWDRLAFADLLNTSSVGLGALAEQNELEKVFDHGIAPNLGLLVRLSLVAQRN